jgi:DNA invertase Pin-like site-specific DNA recombinase
VSTSDRSAKQDYERQRYLLEHSGIEFDEIYEEHVSGGVRGDQRKEFNRMIDNLGEKDLVCFTETSRFGRNYIDCFDMLDILTQQKKCTVKFLSNGIELEGGEKMNPYTWMTVSQFFIQDEFLKRQIGYNTSNALQRKKEQGIRLGKKVDYTKADEERAIELRKQGLTLQEVHDRTGISISAIHRLCKGEG